MYPKEQFILTINLEMEIKYKNIKLESEPEVHENFDGVRIQTIWPCKF